MSGTIYKAAICGGPKAFGVVFPDFIGCVSAGDTVEEATLMAQEALQLHVEGMIEDGETLPVATDPTLAEVAEMFSGSEDEENWVALIDVTIESPQPEATMPLQVKVDLVQRIAALAEATATRIDSRRFIEQAVEHEIERYRKSA